MKVSLSRFIYLLIIALLVIQLGAHLLLLTKGVEYLTTVLTHDDTYYYLETVWNHRTLGFPTFDGIHKTNGFHFLWYLVLLAISYLTPSKQLLLPIALGICSLLNALSYLFFMRLGKRTGSDLLALILSLLWFIVNLTPLHSIIGMENSLHLLVTWWVIYETLIFFDTLRIGKRVNLLRLAISLIAIEYTRVDSAFYSTIIFAVCVVLLIQSCKGFREFLATYGRSLILSMTIAVFAAAIQLALNWKWGGTVIPLTGIIKMSGTFPDPGYTTFGKGRKVLELGLPPNLLPWYIYPILFLGMAATAILALKKATLMVHHSLLNTLLLLFTASIAYSSHLWLAPAREVSYWYFSPVKINWILCLGLAIYLLVSMHLCGIYKILRRIIIPAIFAVWITLSIRGYFDQFNFKADPETLYEARYQAALWIKQNIPDQVLIASWNAGQLGFFSGHRVVNLDGLVNDKFYYENVLKGRLSLSIYLKNENVKYLVDYYDYTQDGIFKHLTSIKSFPVNDAKGGEPIRVWDLSSLPPDLDVGYYPKQP